VSRSNRRIRGVRGPGRRLRAGLRRHGVLPRPRELRRLLRANDLRFTFGNSIELYEEGRAGLDAMLQAVAAARRRIHLETYIFRGDATGRRFVAAMTERARAGVEVRLLYDGFGSLGLDSGALAELRAAGGDAVAFNPLGRLYPHWAPRRRDHRKLLVVDGEVAFTGGLNIGDEYWRAAGQAGAPQCSWRDAHVRITGPAVAMLEAVFLESWFRADGPDRPWAESSEPPPAAADGEAVAVVADGPTYHRRRMRDLLTAALERSQRRARFATPYFIPGRALRAALAGAAARGVEVELLLAGYTDHPVLRWAARDRLSNLIACGVRVYEYESAMMHAKVAVFDGRWALLGTSNLDRQSLQHSYEVNLLLEGEGIPARLDAMLVRDMQGSREITLAELEARSAFERLRDRVAAFLLTRV
jgi:cardiolipin synthase